jgi:hypothetical protein
MIHPKMVAALAVAVWGTVAAYGEPKLSADQFAAVHKLIKPQPGESKWAAIPWLTNLPEARRKAAAEDKPLFVWRAGGGEVLGRA